jgi:hypothetical protein
VCEEREFRRGALGFEVGSYQFKKTGYAPLAVAYVSGVVSLY